MSVRERDGHPLLTQYLTSAQDVFALRREAQAAGEALGMERQDQVRLATALSELGRDRLGCAGLVVTFTMEPGDPAVLSVAFEWTDGPAPSPESLRLAARLVPHVAHRPGPPHRLLVRQPVPAGGPAAEARYERVREALRPTADTTLADDLRAQTRDLIATLEETRAQGEELRRLNEELEETNRGVMALYAELSQELEETNSGVVALHSELEDKSRQLREAGEAKTRFWTNVSHELRTPANAVVGLSQLLLAPDSPVLHAEQHEQVRLIAASGHTLLALVSDLLDVAKAEAGQLEPHLGPVDLRSVIGQLRGTFNGVGLADGVRLLTPEPATLPVVVTDEDLLTRILRNLLSNAVKFTEKGEIRLDVDTMTDGPQHWLTFTVTDTGIGIHEQDVTRVFEEFYQVPGPRHRGRQGTGIGLPYARALAELLGGGLTLTSTPGAGTRVEVQLPGRPAAALVRPPDDTPAPERSPEPAPPAPGPDAVPSVPTPRRPTGDR
ncbi:HAMP domain-containing sensor histidine kinase [Streptomyces sp. SL13]|uniref:histidine kinase n=1 Tax=Streptantibioticus silvisoli TaxID=2705255 RepID=A0AA90GYV1_9ACTN|nr:HAMP domain-containing sensor histidine kinase [Streptantibioticus silvisoli]MDI5970773.1 HAMP domain-containing sensor histidine kinase [Streptantibioticus silvisoli]